MMKILLTGSNGQLGRELAPMLERLWPGGVECADIDTLDITDAGAVEAAVERLRPTHIVNCAAFTAVDRAESEPELCHRVNALATANLADAARRHGAKMVHVSTDYVFDGTACRPYRETDTTSPLGVYGRTKREGEQMLLERCPDAVIVRTAWLYSPHGNNFVKTMLRLGREREELGVVTDQIGTPTSATDLARAITEILKAPEWHPGIYHFTDEGVASWYDFTVAIHRLAGITGCRVRPIMTADYPTPARRPHYSVLDKSLIKSTFGIEIPHWLTSLAECVEILNNQATTIR